MKFVLLYLLSKHVYKGYLWVMTRYGLKTEYRDGISTENELSWFNVFNIFCISIYDKAVNKGLLINYGRFIRQSIIEF